jgi:hypothetical protein
LTGGNIVGYLPTVGDVEHFSILLGKGSALTACANARARLLMPSARKPAKSVSHICWPKPASCR